VTGAGDGPQALRLLSGLAEGDLPAIVLLDLKKTRFDEDQI
jgi:hypothetical protein